MKSERLGTWKLTQRATDGAGWGRIPEAHAATFPIDGVLLPDPGTRKLTNINPFMTELLCC